MTGLRFMLPLKKLVSTVLCATAILAAATPATAQEIKPLDVYQDPNGIDLTTNNVSTSKAPSISIPAAPELTFRDLADFIPMLEVQLGTPQTGFEPEVYTVSAGSIASDAFKQCPAEVCPSAKGSGSSLNTGGGIGNPIQGLGSYDYTQGGTGKFMRFQLETDFYPPTIPPTVKKYLAYEINNPGGRNLSLQYESAVISGVTRHRPSVVTSTAGYELRFTYISNQPDTNWGYLEKAEIVAVGSTTALASLEYLGNNVKDIDGRIYGCVCSPSIFGNSNPSQKGSRMKLPGETAEAFDTTRQQNSQVRTVESDGVTYTYTSVPDTHWTHVISYGPDGTWKRTMDKVTITGPDGFYSQVDITNTIGPAGQNGEPRRRIDSVTDSQGRVTSYEYNALQRLEKIIYPEGNAIEVDYDTRGNLTARRTIAKPGSNQATLVESAGFSSTSCGLGFSCNLPQWTKDANGNQTHYTWDHFHGGMLTQLDPVNEQNRRRKVKNTWSGYTPINGETCPTTTQFGLPGSPRCIPRLLEEEVCETDANGTELTCGTAQSFVRKFTYFEATSLPETETVTDGANGGPLTTTYTYDTAGRQLSADGPLPGSDGAAYSRYDILGRKIWAIGAKGENGLRPATKTTYRDADDQVEKVETGTVAGNTTATSPTTLSFVEAISEASTVYNSRRLATSSRVKAGSTTYSVTQMSYDARNREDCSAVRMNSAVWNSLPASACTPQATGAEGPDRISKKHYDTESRVIRIEQGVGTSLVRDYATYTFTPNGQMASMTDARGFKASMMHDGFDRQTHWYFPSKTATGAINPNDFEYYEYDANGNRSKLRKRDGSELEFTYDKLNRVTKKTVPSRAGLDAAHTRDVFYRYDIRGLQTHAKFDTIGGDGLTTFYDRYGRVTRNWDKMDGVSRNLRYEYLPDGSRFKLKFPDSKEFRSYYWPGGQFNHMTGPSNDVFVDYNYNTRGELREIARDSTAPDQAWTYDPIGRLASTGWTNGGSNNVTWSFTRNPASQIKTETQTNDAFSWDGHIDVTRNYTTNGLNQYTSVSGQGYCYDANGNLTTDGQYAYLYDIENRLVEMRAITPGACPTNTSGYTGQIKAKLRYDPLGRLHEVENFISGVAQGPTRFLYDGDALVAEFNASNTMLARYIHGPAAILDDPITEYSGSGTAVTDRVNLYTDARGSIVLRTNSAGGAPVINTYDEYGVSGTTNAGRFQYTGQVWLPELGMNYYKARMYSPQLGRFMQTDPIGYDDNVNLYAYTGNDPVNGVDPSGKELRVLEAKGGNGTERTAIISVLAQAARSDPELKKRLETVVNSSELVVVKPNFDGPTNSIPNRPFDAAKPGSLPEATGKGSGSRVNIDMNGGDVAGSVVHEILSHAHDSAEGELDYTRHSNGLRQFEEDATQVENQFHRATGNEDKVRDEYAGRPVEPFKKEEDE